jgi:hypothetical protein
MMSRCKSETCHATCSTEPCTALGPYPATAVAALADLGLTDQEIANYFRVQPERITRLRLKVVPELSHVCGSDVILTYTLARK